MTVGVTGLLLQGVEIRNFGINLRVLDGLDSFAGLELSRANRSWQQGSHVAAGYRFQYPEREFTLGITIVGQDPTDGGGMSTTPVYLEDNFKTFMNLLHSNDGSPLSLVKVLPSGQQKEALVYPTRTFEVSDSLVTRDLAINFTMVYPFWRDPTEASQTGKTGSFSLTNNGNGPVADMQITFSAAGNLVHVDSGDTITVTGDTNILISMPSCKVTKAGVRNGSAAFTAAYGIEMRPGSNDFTATGTVDITYHHSYLS